MKTKTVIIATLQLLTVFSLVSCAHVYKAPDSTKIKALTTQVKVDQQKTHQLVTEAKEAIKESQEHADAIVVISHDLAGKLSEVIKVAPPELQPALAEIKILSDQQQTRDDALLKTLITAYTKQTQLDTHVSLTDEHVAALNLNQTTHFKEDEKLAKTATDLSTQVAYYQRHWFIGWIVFISGIVIAVIWGALKLYRKFML